MDTPIAQVEVASAWSSKINWTQFVGGAAMMLTFATGGKVGMTVDQQTALVTVIGMIQAGVTWFLRTYKTRTVTPGSVASTPPNVMPIVVKVLIAAFLLSAFLFAPAAKAEGRMKLGPIGQKIADDVDNTKAVVTGKTDPKAALPCMDITVLTKLTLANLVPTMKACVRDVHNQLVTDTRRALESAQAFTGSATGDTAVGDNDAINCLKPGLALFEAATVIPAVPAVLNPDGSVKTPEVPEIEPGPILLFQKYREFTIKGGLTSCQAWVNGPVNATAAAGVAGAAGIIGGAALVSPIK